MRWTWWQQRRKKKSLDFLCFLCTRHYTFLSLIPVIFAHFSYKVDLFLFLLPPFMFTLWDFWDDIQIEKKNKDNDLKCLKMIPINKLKFCKRKFCPTWKSNKGAKKLFWFYKFTNWFSFQREFSINNSIIVWPFDSTFIVQQAYF